MNSDETINALQAEIKALNIQLSILENALFVTRNESKSTSKKYSDLLDVMQCKNKELELLKEKSEEINRKLEEQVLKSSTMATIAASANAAKDIFLANISHEFRTPLNVIIGYTEILIDSIQDENISSTLKIIQKRSQELLRLINDLMDISKIEAGKLSLVYEKTDIRQIIDDVVKSVKKDLQNKNIKWKIFVDKKIPQLSLVDPLRIKQILFNLVDNAVKFTEKGCISINCQKQSMDKKESDVFIIQFRVSDTGIGIPPHKQPELFKPFVQIQESTNKKCGGTGLGLAIAKRLSEMMGGNIWLENNVPNGSVFCFTIRVIDFNDKIDATINNRDKTINHSSNKDIISENSINLLVVEDDENTREMVSKIIKICDKNSKIKVFTASNGQEAIFIYHKEKIDLVLTDMLMPIMDGYSLMSQIRSIEKESDKHTTIIAMTAYAMDEDKERCLSHGADCYLPKPLNRSDFVLIINKAIEQIFSKKS